MEKIIIYDLEFCKNNFKIREYCKDKILGIFDIHNKNIYWINKNYDNNRITK